MYACPSFRLSLILPFVARTLVCLSHSKQFAMSIRPTFPVQSVDQHIHTHGLNMPSTNDADETIEETTNKPEAEVPEKTVENEKKATQLRYSLLEYDYSLLEFRKNLAEQAVVMFAAVLQANGGDVSGMLALTGLERLAPDINNIVNNKEHSGLEQWVEWFGVDKLRASDRKVTANAKKVAELEKDLEEFRDAADLEQVKRDTQKDEVGEVDLVSRVEGIRTLIMDMLESENRDQ